MSERGVSKSRVEVKVEGRKGSEPSSRLIPVERGSRDLGPGESLDGGTEG